MLASSTMPISQGLIIKDIKRHDDRCFLARH